MVVEVSRQDVRPVRPTNRSGAEPGADQLRLRIGRFAVTTDNGDAMAEEDLA